MRTKILLSILLILGAGFGSWKLWKNSQEKAAQAREAIFTKPHDDAMNAFVEKRYIDAEAILTAMLAQIERDEPGSGHEAIVLHDLGATARVQNRISDAETYYKRAVDIQKKILSPDSPDLAFSLVGLSQTLHDDGREAEVGEIDREILAIFRQHPENFPRDFPMCLLNLGSYAARQQHFEEAENLLAEAEMNFQKSEGANSLHAALASADLAEVYDSEGKYAESEASYRKALAIQEARLNPDDADLAHTLNGLGNALAGQGKSSQAETLKARANAIYDRAIPSQTISESWLLIQRGQTRAAEGKYKEAESLYKQAIEADEAKFGADNPEVADDLDFLAWLYRDEDGFSMDTSESLFKRILAIREKSFGKDSPEASDTVSDVALLYSYEKKYGLGESFAARALPIQEKAYGPDSLEVSTTLNHLGICQRDLNKFDQAQTSLTRALAIREKRLPPDHRWVAISARNLATVYLAQGQPEKAALLLATYRPALAKYSASR
jgi:tetratricopeptide (TPR) repeat protein